MIFLNITISRYISDDPQPGVVECEMVDAHGKCWRFVEKTAIVSAEKLDAETHYPKPGVIAGEVIGYKQDPAGREIVVVDTERPWEVASVEGVNRFEVFADSVIPK